MLVTTSLGPLHGTVDRRTVTVGADHWFLVTASRRPLTGSLSRALPWTVLALGLLGSVVLSAVIALVLRRRAYALALVDARTAELRDTLADLETARTQAENANRSKSEFLSRMSHELRTPLNAVLGFAQLLELDELTDRQEASVAQIAKGGRHLLDLINEVLDVSRIETGNLGLSCEPVLPSEVVSDVLDLVRPLALDRSITLTTNLRHADEHVLADRQRLRQVLLNLLSNAVKYNRVGGSVSVGSADAPDAGKLRITVTDTGPGIAAEQRALLFEPFERLGAEHTNVEGTGVGLALSRCLAEAMGGSLDVESTPGQGSRFWIELPRVESPLQQHRRLNPEPVPARVTHADPVRRTVLYIEDNLANVRLIEQVLGTRSDLTLVTAMQGRLGLELARGEHPALVLLDLHLPDTDGAQVLAALRSDPATAAVPVVILSADATENQIERLLAQGAHAYLTKPIDVRQLLGLVDELVAKPAAEPLVGRHATRARRPTERPDQRRRAEGAESQPCHSGLVTRFAFHCAAVDLETRSKLLFGNRHRLRIGECVARRNLVTAREIAAELRLADSVVRAELLRLVEAGLLTALPSVQKERYYELTADPFWAYCREEVARFAGATEASR